MKNLSAYSGAAMQAVNCQMEVSSSVFAGHTYIPKRYTCEGSNINPPLDIKGIPPGTKCLAVIMDDLDARSANWLHWICWNIPVTHHLKENKCHGEQGINDFGRYGYGGPCPPRGTHQYSFKVYALNSLLKLPDYATRSQVEEQLNTHMIAFGELVGLYKSR